MERDYCRRMGQLSFYFDEVEDSIGEHQRMGETKVRDFGSAQSWLIAINAIFGRMRGRRPALKS